ncbi:MAG: FtsQ-type POTRA domain-containing protein [Proteobacteria bacterium]|nr:FtsQ-type POTRA domain-containing protein [Pseudomonadota bacterium]
MNIFKIQEISISGCRQTSPAMIRELTGIRYQASLVRLNPEHIAAILRSHPWIAAVEVTRDWPDVVVVYIKEYVPEALITQDVPGGRQFFYMDKNGVVFAPVDPGQDMDLPVITGLETKGNIGQRRPNGVVGAVATIMDSDAEVMEMRVPAREKFNSVHLKELHFPKGSIVGAIVRDQQVLLPSGETIIEIGDNLVIFFTKKAAADLERFLSDEG